MYVPPHFRVDDPAALVELMRRHSFAMLITDDGHAPFATHLPVLHRPGGGPHGTLVGHVARANPQWRHFAAGREALVVFRGPHAYVSPAWYATTPNVPTWNYAAVHAYGVPQVIDDHDRLVALLQEMIGVYESPREEPWPGELPAKYRDDLIHGIVGFEMPVTRLDGKFKLSQNKAKADAAGAADALARSDAATDRAVAAMMRDVNRLAASRADDGETRLPELLRAANPVLDPTPFAIVAADAPTPEQFAAAWAVVREAEGTTLVVPAALAPADAPRWARVTLAVHSSLEAVGFLAALTQRLAAAGIACNAVSAFRHDHLFVPWPRRHESLAALRHFARA
ncbi:MAG: ACT domain-containing protein [Gemmataceae bacterium]